CPFLPTMMWSSIHLRPLMTDLSGFSLGKILVQKQSFSQGAREAIETWKERGRADIHPLQIACEVADGGLVQVETKLDDIFRQMTSIQRSKVLHERNTYIAGAKK